MAQGALAGAPSTRGFRVLGWKALQGKCWVSKKKIPSLHRRPARNEVKRTKKGRQRSGERKKKRQACEDLRGPNALNNRCQRYCALQMRNKCQGTSLLVPLSRSKNQFLAAAGRSEATKEWPFRSRTTIKSTVERNSNNRPLNHKAQGSDALRLISWRENATPSI
jgi:hypothetical protein